MTSMSKEDLVWAFAKALGIYLLADSALALAAVLQAPAMGPVAGKTVWIGLVNVACHAVVGWFLVFRVFGALPGRPDSG